MSRTEERTNLWRGLLAALFPPSCAACARVGREPFCALCHEALDPAPAFEVETLVHELRERLDPQAEGGRAGFADRALTPRDRVWSGPLRRYPAGRYRLWVRLKLDRATAAPLA